MSDVFVCATLLYRPLLAAVLGGAPPETIPAELPGYGVFRADDADFPVIAPAPGAGACGLLLRGLDAPGLARLRFYEAISGHEPQPREVRLRGGGRIRALVFVPPSGRSAARHPWSLEGWAAKWGAVAARAATEEIALKERMTPQQVAARRTIIRIRAAAWLAARARPGDPERDLGRDVVVHAHSRPYANFFAVEEMDLQFRRHDGSLSALVNRAALLVGQAVVVLPYDPARDAVLLVEQFRAPLFIAGDRAPWVWEPVAGLVDPGETPEQSARREAMEEAGLTLSRLEPAGQVYSSTGSSSEYLHLFVGIAELTTVTGTHGLAEEGEDIRSRILGFDELMRGVDGQIFRDMPLVTTALWLARHRDRLRGRA